jgi:hypothetical protein
VPVCRFRYSERLTSNRYRLTVTSFAAPCAVKPEALQKRRFCAFAELSVLRRIADSELTSCEVAWVPTADVMLCGLGNASAPHWKASAPAARREESPSSSANFRAHPFSKHCRRGFPFTT